MNNKQELHPKEEIGISLRYKITYFDYIFSIGFFFVKIWIHIMQLDTHKWIQFTHLPAPSRMFVF
jgi:hypothetical protein